jgi:hypothetical protein
MVLLAVGIFLVVMAPMLRWYAYPRLAVAPVNQRSVTILEGKNATIFDIGSLSEIQTELEIKANTIGDAKAAEEAPGNTVVWVTSSTTTSEDGVIRAHDVERVAFDAHTGYAVNCCDEFISTTEGVNDPVEHGGLVVKFPFRTEKKTYQWWDGSLKQAVPMTYVKEETIQGLDVLRFEGTIEPTQVGSMELPASLLGVEGEGNVEAQEMYSNKRTF